MATRLGADTVDNYGRLRKNGTGVPEREDFNTLDNPFTWYVDANGTVKQPPANQPGLHFAVFVPTSGKFHIARNSMNGILSDATDLRTQYGLTDADIGFNSEMQATHRQNYIVPPRAPTVRSRWPNCSPDARSPVFRVGLATAGWRSSGQVEPSRGAIAQGGRTVMVKPRRRSLLE